MRHFLLLGTLGVCGLTACSSDCGPVDKYNSFTYRVFANPVTYDVDNAAFTDGPEYWSYGSPANGVSEWQFRWGGAASGPVVVVIDGQEFEGTGDLDDVECGSALLNFSGTYIDDTVDVEHTFNASMTMQLWAEGVSGGQLGAFLVWKESWSHPSSESGTFSANSHLTGELSTQGS